MYLIYKFWGDDCTHLGYCETEEEAMEIEDKLNSDAPMYTLNFHHGYEKLDLINAEELTNE